MISTRGRYAVRVMLDLAAHNDGSYIPMRDVAARQEISPKYLEKIMPDLTRGGFVEGSHGKGGGYRLCRAPADCRVGDMLRATEGDLAPVACLASGAAPCSRAPFCPTLPMWKKYYEMTRDFFDGITLEDLMANPTAGDYVI